MNIRRFFYLLPVILLFLTAGKIQAQTSYCASTNPLTGQITITAHWSSPVSADSCKLKWGTAPSNLSDSVMVKATYPELIYIFPAGTINGINSNYYFNLILKTNPLPTTIFSNIHLQFSSTDQNAANLSWNNVNLPGTGNYIIQRLDNAIWKTIANIAGNGAAPATLGYSDTIAYPYCNPTILNYRVTYQGLGAACSSLSNEVSGQFFDGYGPSNPSNDTVSLYRDPNGIYTGCPVIGWQPSAKADIAGYILYRYENSVFDSIYTIPKDSSFFIDKSLKACTQSYTYALAAIDSCGKKSYGTFITAPHSISLSVPDIDPCDRRAHLSWNTYDNMPGGLKGYIVYRQVNNGGFAAVDTLSAAATSYPDSTLFLNGNFYTYFVKAISNSGSATSSSCRVSKLYTGPVAPDTLYIKQASVINDSYVEVSYYYGAVNTAKRLVLERASMAGGAFTPIDTLTAPTSAFLPQQSVFNDTTARVHQQSYVYRIAAIDSCNKVTLYSQNTARTIYLSCTYKGNNSNQLDWNAYLTWLSDVDRYEIHRLVNNAADPAGALSSQPFSVFTYLDDVSAVTAGSEICYYIMAFEKAGNPFAAGASSTSNISCAIRDPEFFMPNAFRPDGKNNRFRPVSNYVDQASFVMQIFSKWGQLVFETNSLYNGWDGTINGIAAPGDVYTYRIKYKSVTGNSYEKRGVVSLLR